MRLRIPAVPYEPSRDDLARERALDAIGRMRSQGLSLKQAAAAAHTTPTTVKKYTPNALQRIERAWAATAADRYARQIRFLTERGPVVVTVRDSKTASLIAKYMAEVDRYLRTGRTDGLRQFAGRGLRTKSAQYPFITDRRTLDRLGGAGLVSFEDLYALRG